MQRPSRIKLTPQGLLTINVVVLLLGITLLIGSMQVEALAWGKPLRGVLVRCLWGFTSVVLTGLFAVFALCLLALNISFSIHSRRMARASFHIAIWLSFTLAVASVVLTPCAVSWVEKRSREAALSIVSDQHRAVAEVCNRIFEDQNYINQLPPGVGSYAQVGSNDHVIVWMGESGDAIWFDHGGSTSSFGIVCVREGVLPEKAISNYNQRIEEGRLCHLHNSLYYWP